MAHYFAGELERLGLPPSVLVRGANGLGANVARGADVPTAFTVADVGAAPGLLRRPVPAARAARRRDLLRVFGAGFGRGLPAGGAAASWERALEQAFTVTDRGAAAEAFDLTGVRRLPAGGGAYPEVVAGLTLARELVARGVPYVSLGVPFNDSHADNQRLVRRAWAETAAPAVAGLAESLRATGRRVLVLMGGEFGRTPQTVADGRDGRDHWASGFSWALLSVNQPRFRTGAVGHTGPDGTWTVDSPEPLRDPVRPGALGGFVYRALGLPVGEDPALDVPTRVGPRTPLDPDLAAGRGPGSARWLLERFGVA